MGEVAQIDNWDELTQDQLDVLERKIAGKYMGIDYLCSRTGYTGEPLCGM